MDNTNTKIIHSSFWANFFKAPTAKGELQKSLNSIPPFMHLSRRDLNLLFNIIHNRNYVADEYIFYQGDPGIGLYIIIEGEVVIERSAEDGSKIELAVFGKGDFFGELALVDGEKRSASAIARTDAKLAVIFKPDLDEFIENYPKKGVKILQGISHIIAARLRRLNQQYLDLQKQTAINSEEVI